MYTDEQIVKALTETKGMVYLAADRVGCNPDTIYARAEKSKSIQDAMRNERGKVVDTAELKLFSAILRDEPWAIRMALMTLGKNRGYVEKTEVESTTRTTLELVEEIVDGNSNSPPNNPAPPVAG